jgi:ankyrin
MCAAGFIEGLELLKEKGCDLSKADSDGFTPAHCAAREGHLPALRLLHSYGVPMNVKDKDGRTPAYCATKKGHPECAAFLKEVMPIDLRVTALVETGDVNSLHRLQSEKAWTDLETAVHSMKEADGNTRHYTAMVLAAVHKQLEVMRWLIEKGAKVDEIREGHALPSNAAAGIGFIEGLGLLKEKGCDLSKADSNGLTPVCAHARQEQGWPRTC